MKKEKLVKERILHFLANILIKIDRHLILLPFIGLIGLCNGYHSLLYISLYLFILLILVVLVFPLGQWLTFFLENRFSKPNTLPSTLEGIIILGSGFNLKLSAQRKRACYNIFIGRLIDSINVINVFPSLKKVFTGGGIYLNLGINESELAKEFYTKCGVDISSMLFETEARNTNENALLSYDMIKPQGKWLLVTSALHMPRSVGIFRKRGWDVIPYPVDYHTENYLITFNFNFSQALELWKYSMHELLCMAINYFVNKSDNLIPRPAPYNQ